ncbi:hypothetical protein ACVJGD_000603 [Bradyrhizobium sp. USDA 10063]
MVHHAEFKLVCDNCNSLSIRIDVAEGAPSSTQIRCGHCEAPRGTLGNLRRLASKRDTPESDLDEACFPGRRTPDALEGGDLR